MPQYSWIAKHVDKGGRHRDYTVKITASLPSSKFELIGLVEEASQQARYQYEIKDFLLMVFERGSTRPFGKRRFVMQFKIHFAGWEDHPNISTAQFDASTRDIFFLKQDYIYGNTMEIPAEAQPNFSEPDLLTAHSGPKYVSAYTGLNGRAGPYAGMNKRIKRTLLMGGHGPSKPQERIVKGMWKKPLTRSWRLTASHGPSEDSD
jgi:hypothetical protein